LFYGIRSPFAPRHGWGRSYLQWLKGIELPEGFEVCFESLIELYEYLSDSTHEDEPESQGVIPEFKVSQRLKLLCSVPGIGTLIGMEILVEYRRWRD